jgi:HEAT repeat protein
MKNINSCLELAKTGHRESAFHCLLDLGEGAIPRLAEAYRAEADPEVRNLLVEVVWQLRSPSSIEFLGEALQDPNPEVWKQALDGLVTLATPESLQILESARDRVGVADDDFQAWVEGAIEDVSGRIEEWGSTWSSIDPLVAT